MILYICDRCKEKHKNISEMYNLTLSYAGMNKQNLIRDGKYHLCGKCTREMERQFNDQAEDQDDGK